MAAEVWTSIGPARAAAGLAGGGSIHDDEVAREAREQGPREEALPAHEGWRLRLPCRPRGGRCGWPLHRSPAAGAVLALHRRAFHAAHALGAAGASEGCGAERAIEYLLRLPLAEIEEVLSTVLGVPRTVAALTARAIREASSEALVALVQALPPQELEPLLAWYDARPAAHE